MTTSAEWAQRIASKNPVWPWEWTVIYVNGNRFFRVCPYQRMPRTTIMAPLAGAIGIRIIGGPGGPHIIQGLSQTPTRIVALSRIHQPVNESHGIIAGWRFGFMYGEQFVGAAISADGTVFWQ